MVGSSGVFIVDSCIFVHTWALQEQETSDGFVPPCLMTSFTHSPFDSCLTDSAGLLVWVDCLVPSPWLVDISFPSASVSSCPSLWLTVEHQWYSPQSRDHLHTLDPVIV